MNDSPAQKAKLRKMNKYGAFANTADGRKCLCAKTEAETIGKATAKLSKWADAFLGEGNWWVEKINEGGEG